MLIASVNGKAALQVRPCHLMSVSVGFNGDTQCLGKVERV